MMNSSLNLSNKLDKTSIDCLLALQTEARALGLDMLLVGATVRDIILGHVHGIKIGRATMDVDIGILVNDWSAYENFKQQLIATALFTPDSKRNHRLYFHGLPVDIIPFGGIETETGNIIWPPDNDSTMRVTGFKDAFEHALSAHIGQGKEIRLTSLPGMAILKIIAWDDRHNELPTKDAEDLALILYNYANAGNVDRLYNKYPEFITSVDGDIELAGARLLGLDMAMIMSGNTKQTIQEILARTTIPGTADKLVEAIYPHLPGREYERALALLQNLQ
jgi:predicted nucleotidyltransferase